MSSRADYQTMFSYLKSLDFHFLETWVIECVNYYKSTNPTISLDLLKNEVKQQWLLVDLREIKVPSLPPDLKSKEKIILDGKYAVQVETMIDSSQSCYSQFRKMRNISDEDIETTKEPQDSDAKSTSRCLTFGISDGVQEIHAMEYRPITKIRTNDPELLPGFKMVIVGPVECRKGMILLKNENVRVCGGEVDKLITSNNLKSILMAKLNLDEADFQDDNTPPAKDDNTQPVTQPGNSVASLLSENEDIFMSLPLEAEILAGGTQIQNEENQTNREEESVQSGVSRKHILSEEDLETPREKRLSLDPEIESGVCFSSAGNSAEFDADEIFFDDNMDLDLQAPQLSGSKVKKSVQTQLPSFFNNNDLSVNSAKRTSVVSQTPLSISGPPFVYLKQIMSMELRKFTIFTIKAIILTLKKKITIENNEFNLRAAISDGSLCMDVDFSSEILENLLGFSPCEMAAMVKAKQTNSAVSQRVKESFSKVQEKLISLNCLMKVKFFTSEKHPLVLLLEELTAQHLNELKGRKPKES